MSTTQRLAVAVEWVSSGCLGLFPACSLPRTARKHDLFLPTTCVETAWDRIGAEVQVLLELNTPPSMRAMQDRLKAILAVYEEALAASGTVAAAESALETEVSAAAVADVQWLIQARQQRRVVKAQRLRRRLAKGRGRCVIRPLCCLGECAFSRALRRRAGDRLALPIAGSGCPFPWTRMVLYL